MYVQVPWYAHGSYLSPPCFEAGLSSFCTFLCSRLADLQLLADSPAPTSHLATGLLGLESQTTLSGFYVNSRNWAQVGWLSCADPFPSRQSLKWTVFYGSPPPMKLTACQVLLKSFWHVFAVCAYAHTCRDRRTTVGSRHWTWAVRLVSKSFTHGVILLAQSLPRRQVNEPKETRISITQVCYAMCPVAFELYEHAEKTLRDR